jgi:hypothetical protein
MKADGARTANTLRGTLLLRMATLCDSRKVDQASSSRRLPAFIPSLSSTDFSLRSLERLIPTSKSTHVSPLTHTLTRRTQTEVCATRKKVFRLSKN